MEDLWRFVDDMEHSSFAGCDVLPRISFRLGQLTQKLKS
jgi:hypothetical protein